MFELFLTSLLASIGISIPASAIGSIMIWQRMAFLGDTIAHSSLLGVAIALLLSIPINLGIFLVVMSLVYLVGRSNKFISSDSFLAIIAYACLAIAVLIISKISINVELESYLFGDILTTSLEDIVIIYLLALLICFWLFFRFNKIVLISINKDLASTSGIKTDSILLEFRIIVGCLIGLSMKIVGVLLVSALLIIPPSAARIFSQSPIEMVLKTFMVNIIASILGISASFYFDLVVGPSIIFGALIIYLLYNLVKIFKFSRNK